MRVFDLTKLEVSIAADNQASIITDYTRML